MSVKKFGPFILDRMIGRGGMGAVYRARDENTDQIVAVKALLLPLEKERERFEAEISTLRLLRHENIVKLYGFGQEDGILYYAMEFVDGPSLATLLRRGRRFTWEETVYIGARICNALKHAHDRGVIHRDIKPANILLMSNGVVKVSDYGIAQYFGNSRLTNANQVVGTIEFMAPEQAQAGAVTPKTDIYSLGALMYALLAGRPPYVAKTLPELLQQYRTSLPEPLRSLRPETPKFVDDVVLELLELQQDKRPGDARLVGRRLEALLFASKTCKNGNPFSDSSFPTYATSQPAPMEDPKSVVSSSRVDLENASTTMFKNSSSGGDQDDEPVEPVRDFPYRPIDDVEGENLDFESPFDKTTERSTSPGLEEQGPRPEEERDDFFIGDGADPEGAGLSDNETSTSQLPPQKKNAAPEAPRPEAAPAPDPSKLAATDAPTEVEKVVIEPTITDDLPTKGTAASTEFDVSFDVASPADASVSEAPRTETASSELGGLLSSKSSALSLDSPTLAADGSSGSGSASSRGSGSAERAARLMSASATTIVDKTIDKVTDAANKKKIVEPIAPNGALVPSRNVPFEELGQSTDEVEATPLDKFRKSVFTPVDEDELGELPENEDAYEPSIFVRFRVLWAVLAFAAIVLVCVSFFRTPSADRLYNRIDRTFSRSAARRFDATLRRSERDMKRFVEIYPNDPRTEKINYFLCELQIDELDQRLERQALSPGRDSALQPILRAYLEARRAAQEDWEVGSEKLAAFIELFGSDAILEKLGDDGAIDASSVPADVSEDSDDPDSGEKKKPSLRGLVVQNRWKLWKGETAPVMSLPDQIVVIAKRRLVALEAEIKTTRRADVALLNDRLITAESIAKENPERAESIRKAAETLYGRYEWARKALSEPVVVPEENAIDASETTPEPPAEEKAVEPEALVDSDASTNSEEERADAEKGEEAPSGDEEPEIDFEGNDEEPTAE